MMANISQDLQQQHLVTPTNYEDSLSSSCTFEHDHFQSTPEEGYSITTELFQSNRSQQHRFPFSPNPFSPNYLPSPQHCEQNDRRSLPSLIPSLISTPIKTPVRKPKGMGHHLIYPEASELSWNINDHNDTSMNITTCSTSVCLMTDLSSESQEETSINSNKENLEVNTLDSPIRPHKQRLSSIRLAPRFENPPSESLFSFTQPQSPPRITPKRGRSRLLTPSPTSSPRSSSLSTPNMSRFSSDFEELSQLGTGSFGTVYECMSRLDGCMYAIKTAKRKAKGNADKSRMLKEVYALAALRDLTDIGTFHIVRYHQAWMEEERLFIQMELCTGTLQEEIQSGLLRQCIPRRYKLLREISMALELIHRNDMVHLDIKPENIFIKGDKYKLGDFGLVTKATTKGNDVEEGDSRYMSLELLSGDDEKDLTKSDIFSFGATLYEVCVARPLPANGDEWHEIRAGNLHFEATYNETPEDLQEIISKMMNPTSSLRPSAHDLLQLRPLLSVEQRKLRDTQNKLKEVLESLNRQQKMLSQWYSSCSDQHLDLDIDNNRKKMVRTRSWDQLTTPRRVKRFVRSRSFIDSI